MSHTVIVVATLILNKKFREILHNYVIMPVPAGVLTTIDMWAYTASDHQVLVPYTVVCRYNAVQYNMIMDTTRQWQ